MRSSRHGLKMGRKGHQGYYNDDNKRLKTNQYMEKTHQSAVLISILLCYALFQLHCGQCNNRCDMHCR